MIIIICNNNQKKIKIYDALCKSKLKNDDYTVLSLKTILDFDISNININKMVVFITQDVFHHEIIHLFLDYHFPSIITVFAPFKIIINDSINSYFYNKKNTEVFEEIIKYYFTNQFITDEYMLDEGEKVVYPQRPGPAAG